MSSQGSDARLSSFKQRKVNLEGVTFQFFIFCELILFTGMRASWLAFTTRLPALLLILFQLLHIQRVWLFKNFFNRFFHIQHYKLFCASFDTHVLKTTANICTLNRAQLPGMWLRRGGKAAGSNAAEKLIWFISVLVFHQFIIPSLIFKLCVLASSKTSSERLQSVQQQQPPSSVDRCCLVGRMNCLTDTFSRHRCHK